MSSLEGFSTDDYANFDTSAPVVTQLPSLPVDQVLPKAVSKIAKKEAEKIVTFEDPVETVPVIKATPDESETKHYFCKNNAMVIIAVLLLLAAYYYKEYM